MRPVRLTAAMLALLTVLVTLLFWFIPEVGLETILCTAIAAVCLGIVTPFEARDPPQRKRVVAASAVYVVMIGIASVFALQMPAERIAPMSALATLGLGGVALVIWSFGIRNRVSRPRWREYYDR